MHYNLLYYGIYTDFCTSENNNIEQKSQNLKIILNHFKPSVFTVNEMGRGSGNLDILLNSSLNVDGVTYYDYASYTNSTNSSIVNGLFYDSRKFGLVDQSIPSSVLRDINLYKLFYKSNDLESSQDTVFLTCVVAHLKAGRDASDQQTRTIMINNVMNYLNQSDYSGNLLFMGDFNMQSSYEQAFQMMISHINPEIRLTDPIDINGIWNNNPDVASYHTQSTRTSGNGCFVTGGLDDRFDFILASHSIMSGAKGFRYIENSYLSPGQDGIRFNQSLVSPANISQPQDIIDALYNFSDHLPVMIDLVTTDLTNYINIVPTPKVYYNNPVSHKLFVEIDNYAMGFFTTKIYSVTGILHYENYGEILTGKYNMGIDVSSYTSGVYVLRITTSSGMSFSGKFTKY